MTNPLPPELFAERPIRSEFNRGLSYRVRRAITISVLALVAGGGLYAAFGHGTRQPSEIPVIAAEGTYKQKPEQPGGIDIPHQDVEVYQALGEGAPSKQQGVEHLLPMPETPKATSTKLTQTAQIAPPPTESITAAVPEAAPPAIVTTVTPAPVAVAPAPVVAKVAAAKPAPVKQATPKPTPKTAAGTDKTPIIQLASVSDLAAAESMAAKLQDKYAAFLGGVPLHVVKADLGEKGVFYRIQSKPISADLANQICRALENHSAGCLIVRH